MIRKPRTFPPATDSGPFAAFGSRSGGGCRSLGDCRMAGGGCDSGSGGHVGGGGSGAGRIFSGHLREGCSQTAEHPYRRKSSGRFGGDRKRTGRVPDCGRFWRNGILHGSLRVLAERLPVGAVSARPGRPMRRERWGGCGCRGGRSMFPANRAGLLVVCSESGSVRTVERGGGDFGKIKEKIFFLVKKFGFGKILATFALAMPL